MVKKCVTIRKTCRENLCHNCGKFYNDIVMHVISSCDLTVYIREIMWCEWIQITMITKIECSVYLHALSENELVLVILSGLPKFELVEHDLLQFQ